MKRVGIAVKSLSGFCYVVSADQVQIFSYPFLSCVFFHILGFCGKSNHVGPVLRHRGDARHNIRVFHQLERDGIIFAALLFHLFRRDRRGAIVRYRGAGDKNVLFRCVSHDGGLHLQRGSHVDTANRRRRRQANRAAHQRYAGAAAGGGGGNGEAHLAGAVVADIAHRVERFARWTGGDHNVEMLQIVDGRGPLHRMVDNHQWVEHAARAHVAARLAAAVGPPNQQAARRKLLQIMLRDGGAIHLLIHRRHHGHGRGGGETGGGHQIVGHAGIQTGDKVGRRRRQYD